MNTLGTMQVVLEPRLVDRRDRPWKERLFSWPWRPFKKVEETPSQKMLQYNDTHLIMHPATYAHAKRLIKEKK